MKDNSADLHSFLLILQNENELVRIKRDVNAEYEIAAVTARLDRKQAVILIRCAAVTPGSYLML